MSKPRKKKRPPKRVQALPDLEQSKTAVLDSLTSKSGQRSFGNFSIWSWYGKGSTGTERPTKNDSITPCGLPGWTLI
jgi:hypothetical protein